MGLPLLHHNFRREPHSTYPYHPRFGRSLYVELYCYKSLFFLALILKYLPILTVHLWGMVTKIKLHIRTVIDHSALSNKQKKLQKPILNLVDKKIQLKMTSHTKIKTNPLFFFIFIFIFI